MSAFACSNLDRLRPSHITLSGRALDVHQVLDLLNKTVDLTRDGWPVVFCTELFCPGCGGQVEQKYDVCYCWDCENPDDGGHIPLPLSYGSVTSKPMPNRDWRRVPCEDAS